MLWHSLVSICRPSSVLCRIPFCGKHQRATNHNTSLPISLKTPRIHRIFQRYVQNSFNVFMIRKLRSTKVQSPHTQIIVFGSKYEQQEIQYAKSVLRNYPTGNGTSHVFGYWRLYCLFIFFFTSYRIVPTTRNFNVYNWKYFLAGLSCCCRLTEALRTEPFISEPEDY